MAHIITLSSPKYDWFLNEEREDPVSKEAFKIADQVVVCANCKSVMLFDTWVYAGNHCHRVACSQLGETLIDIPRNEKPTIIYFKSDREIIWDTTPINISWLVEKVRPHRIKIEINRFHTNRTEILTEITRQGERELAIVEDTELKLIADNFDKKTIVTESIKIKLYRDAPIISFETDTYFLTEDKPYATLTWNVKYASRYSINNGISVRGDYGSLNVHPKEDTEYVLEATNISRKKAFKSIKLIIARTPIEIDFFVSNKQEILKGDSILLSWNVPRKKEIFLLPSNTVVTNISEVEITPTQDTSYELLVNGHFSNNKKSIFVKVYPIVEIISFQVSKSEIKITESIKFSWIVKNYSKIHLSDGRDLIDVSNLNNYTLTPQKNTHYFLVIESLNSIRNFHSPKIEIIVFYPIKIHFESDRIKTVSSLPITLSWKVENATTIYLYPVNNQDKEVTKLTSIIELPSKSTKYTLVATNKLFKEEKSLFVEVLNFPSMNSSQDNSLANVILTRKIDVEVASSKKLISFPSLYNPYIQEAKFKSLSPLSQLFFNYTNFVKYLKKTKQIQNFFNNIVHSFWVVIKNKREKTN